MSSDQIARADIRPDDDLATPANEMPETAAITARETHKRHAENVWLRGPLPSTDNDLSVEFLTPSGPTRVPRFTDLVEVQRQAGIVHAHRILRVPLADVFILDQIHLALTSGFRRLDESTSGVIHVTSPETGQPLATRRRSARQFFTVDGAAGLRATGSAMVRFVPPEVFARLRDSQETRTPDVGLDLVDGRFSDRGFHTELTSDDADAVMSDHGSDHITAMSMISAIERTMDAEAPGRPLESIAVRFHRYATRGDAPLMLHAARRDRGRFGGIIAQSDRLIATVAFRASEESDRG